MEETARFWGRVSSRLFSPPPLHKNLFVDKVFTHEDWKKHHSAWWRHRMEPVIFAKVALGLIWQLIYVMLVSVLVGIICLYPAGDTIRNTDLTVPANTITFALALLLVFKTNSSYARWWEGRVVWGQIVNFARNYPRMVLWYFDPGQPELRAAALRWAMAGPRALKAHIREGGNVKREVQELLLPHELEYLLSWKNAPQGIGHMLSACVVAAGLEPQRELLLQQQVELFVNMSGACERILKTPIPAAYTRHTSRFLMVYLTLVPFMLWSVLGWFTIFASAIVALLLLGTENIGVNLEQPFHILALDAFCTGMIAGARDMDQQHAAAQALVRQSLPKAPPGRPSHLHASDFGSLFNGYETSLPPYGATSMPDSNGPMTGSPTQSLPTPPEARTGVADGLGYGRPLPMPADARNGSIDPSAHSSQGSRLEGPLAPLQEARPIHCNALQLATLSSPASRAPQAAWRGSDTGSTRSLGGPAVEPYPYDNSSTRDQMGRPQVAAPQLIHQAGHNPRQLVHQWTAMTPDQQRCAEQELQQRQQPLQPLQPQGRLSPEVATYGQSSHAVDVTENGAWQQSAPFELQRLHERAYSQPAPTVAAHSDGRYSTDGDAHVMCSSPQHRSAAMTSISVIAAHQSSLARSVTPPTSTLPPLQQHTSSPVSAIAASGPAHGASVRSGAHSSTNSATLHNTAKSSPPMAAQTFGTARCPI